MAGPNGRHADLSWGLRNEARGSKLGPRSCCRIDGMGPKAGANGGWVARRSELVPRRLDGWHGDPLSVPALETHQTKQRRQSIKESAGPRHRVRRDPRQSAGARRRAPGHDIQLQVCRAKKSRSTCIPLQSSYILEYSSTL